MRGDVGSFKSHVPSAVNRILVCQMRGSRECCVAVMSKSTEIRGNWKARAIGTLAGWLIRMVGMTLRVRMQDASGVTNRKNGPGPVLYAFWHNRVFIMPYVKWKFFNHRNAVVLTSASKDGAVLERAVGVCGIGAVRGSSSRRAVAALVALRQAVKVGKDVCITPDGPRGPKYILQPGLVKIAETTGVPVVMIHVKYHSCWKLKSWDGFVIPKPFSRVEVVMAAPRSVPSQLDENAFEIERQEIERLLRDGVGE